VTTPKPESVRRDKLSEKIYQRAWIGKHPSRLKKLVPYDQLPESAKKPNWQEMLENDKD
jgi:hypothetical protein